MESKFNHSLLHCLHQNYNVVCGGVDVAINLQGSIVFYKTQCLVSSFGSDSGRVKITYGEKYLSRAYSYNHLEIF